MLLFRFLGGVFAVVSIMFFDIVKAACWVLSLLYIVHIYNHAMNVLGLPTLTAPSFLYPYNGFWN